MIFHHLIDISSTFANSLFSSSFSIHSLDSPFITLVISLKENDGCFIEYFKWVFNVS